MNTNALVSVIISAYNHEKYVQETIKSIINQTYQNIELIIVDDGSKDSTWQKIQEMKEICEKRFVRVHFETKENEGTCRTLNRLISLTEGEYIYFIASDDISKPFAIEKEIEFLSNNPEYALVVGDNEFIDSDGQVCYWDEKQNNVYREEDAKYLTFGSALNAHRQDFKFTSRDFGAYDTLYIGNYVPNGYLIRKSIFNKTGLFTTDAPLEDYWMMLQISKYAKLKYLNEILFSYRWHNSNSIKNRAVALANDKKTREFEETILEDEKLLKEKGILDSTACFLRLNKKVKYLELNNQELKTKYQYELNLLIHKKDICNRYIRYKILSKILFGKKRKHYKEKAKIYHEKVRIIRSLNKEYKDIN